MTRFVWLQNRTQAVTLAAALIVLAVGGAYTGVHVSHQVAHVLATCQTGCDLAINKLLDHNSFLEHAFDIVAQLLPAVLGVFWGAPLIARELESGTYRLAWTQGVTRRRWLVTKLATGALATAIVAGAFYLTITWWYRLFDHYDTNQFAVLDRRGIVPIAYALFAFAAGALAGAVIRRTVPAMATTIGAYVVARVATSAWLWPHLLSPAHTTQSLLSSERFGFVKAAGSGITLDARGNGPPNSWTVSSHIADRAGHVASPAELAAFVQQHCANILPPPGPVNGGPGVKAVDPDQFQVCQTKASHLYHFVIAYQPAGRYWAFQWMETGIFVLLALAAAGICCWWVTRRTS